MFKKYQYPFGEITHEIARYWSRANKAKRATGNSTSWDKLVLKELIRIRQDPNRTEIFKRFGAITIKKVERHMKRFLKKQYKENQSKR